MVHSSFWSKVKRFIHDENGPTSVEYAVMLAMIIIAGIGAVLTVGDVQKQLYEDTGQTLSDAMNGSN